MAFFGQTVSLIAGSGGRWGRWHWKQWLDRIGSTSRLKSTVGPPGCSVGAGRNAAARTGNARNNESSLLMGRSIRGREDRAGHKDPHIAWRTGVCTEVVSA